MCIELPCSLEPTQYLFYEVDTSLKTGNRICCKFFSSGMVCVRRQISAVSKSEQNVVQPDLTPVSVHR